MVEYIDDLQREAVKGGGYDITSIEGRSACAEGGPIPFGIAVVAGLLQNSDPTLVNTTYAESCALPDLAGAFLTHPATHPTTPGQTYAAAGTPLPTRGASAELIYLGATHRTYSLPGDRNMLAQPWGPGDTCYTEVTEAVNIHVNGRLWVLVDVDVAPGDAVSFRHTISAPADGIQFLGSYSNLNDAEHQLIPSAGWYRGGLAGGLAVLDMNVQI